MNTPHNLTHMMSLAAPSGSHTGVELTDTDPGVTGASPLLELKPLLLN